MTVIGIMANGPTHLLPDISIYNEEIDTWIAADGGALVLINKQIKLNYAVGDFDSINENENNLVKQYSDNYKRYPAEKDLTDIEIALLKAFELNPDKIYLFGVTGGRLDHELINIQLLYSIVKKDIRGIIIDKQNIIELTTPNSYKIEHNAAYPNISFVPFSKVVTGLTLSGFYYPLENKDIRWGSTLCISNKLLSSKGGFLYREGVLLLIKSRDDN